MKKTYEFEDFLQVFVVNSDFDNDIYEMHENVKYNLVENLKA
jgi:hypothetical protein